MTGCAAVVLVLAAMTIPGYAEGFIMKGGGEEADLVCSGQEPEICLAPGYTEYEQDIRGQYAAYFEALRTAGAPVPLRLEQSNGSSNDAIPLNSLDLMDSQQFRVENNIVRWYARNCPPVRGPGEGSRSRDTIMLWLKISRGGSGTFGSADDLASMPQEEHDAALLAAINDLQQCGQPGSTRGAQ